MLASKKLPIPFLDEQGTYHEEGVPKVSHVCLPDDCVGEKGPGLEIHYGLLSTLQLLAMCVKVPTPALNELLHPVTFQQRLKEIVDFYSNPEALFSVSATDAYNYLRLAAVGGSKGEMRAWIQGMQSGSFVAADDSVIGKATRIVPAAAMKNITKREGTEFWQKPFFMHALAREFSAIRDATCRVNECWLESTDYKGQCTLVFQIIKMMQIYAVNVLRDTMIKEGYTTPDTCVVSARGLDTQEDLPVLANPTNHMVVLHPCFAFVAPGWIEKIANKSHKGLLRHFAPV